MAYSVQSRRQLLAGWCMIYQIIAEIEPWMRQHFDMIFPPSDKTEQNTYAPEHYKYIGNHLFNI